MGVKIIFETDVTFMGPLLASTGTRTRDATVLRTIRAKRKSFERSVLYKGAKEWNSLSVEDRRISFYQMFKNKQRQWLLSTIIET